MVNHCTIANAPLLAAHDPDNSIGKFTAYKDGIISGFIRAEAIERDEKLAAIVADALADRGRLMAGEVLLREESAGAVIEYLAAGEPAAPKAELLFCDDVTEN